jgi:hypothetical protein
MKTEIKSKEVQKTITVEEKLYVLELTHDEAIVVLACVGELSFDDIKTAIIENEYKTEKPLDSNCGFHIFRGLKNLLIR